MTTPLRDPKQPLNDYLRVQSIADRELNRLLVAAAKDIARMIETGEVTGTRAKQLAELLSQIKTYNKTLWTKRIAGVIRKFYPRAMKVAADSERFTREILATAVGANSADLLEESVRPKLNRQIHLLQVRKEKQLSQRVYKNAALTSEKIERIIRQSILQGLTAKEIAKKVEKYIKPSTPGGASYAAMRLARTELNNAFHEAQKLEAQEKPWLMGAKWNLSRSHPRPDICDQYAHGGESKQGVYPVESIPDKPHPHCFCYLTYELIPQDDMVDLIVDLVIKDEQRAS